MKTYTDQEIVELLSTWKIREMEIAGAQAVCHWKYPPPYSDYNWGLTDYEEDMTILLDPTNGYYGIRDSKGKLTTYFCLGPEARVSGGDYTASAIDIGLGLRPDLTGCGLGQGVLSMILEYIMETQAPGLCRVTVAADNGRALRVYQKCGFKFSESFQRKADGKEFHVLLLEVEKELASSPNLMA